MAHRIGNRIDFPQRGDSLLVVDGNDPVGAQRFRRFSLPGANTGNHLHAMLPADIDRGSSNAAESARNQQDLPGSRLDTFFNQLHAGCENERKGGGIFCFQTVGNARQHVAFGNKKLRIRVVHQAHDPIAGLKTLSAWSQGGDCTGDIAPQNFRQWQRHDTFHVAPPYLQVDRIDAGRFYLDQDFARLRLRIRRIFI